MPDTSSQKGNSKSKNKICDNKGFKKKVQQLEFHNNPDLPFFAYGIFKPGQLAYSTIEKFIDTDKTEKIPKSIPYKMLTRDGVPLIEDKEDDSYYTRGYLLYFKNGFKKDAYDTISKTQRKALYDWKEIKVKNDKFNVLVGLNLDRGISDEEDVIYDFNGEMDPLFTYAMEKIKKVVDRIDNGKLSNPNIQNFFTIQMHYMLLWSAIDRYTSLKYDIKNDARVEFVDENKDIIKNVIKKYDNKERIVYNSETLRCNKLDTGNLVGSMFYYYTIRCNVVHNGKEFEIRDFDLLKESLVDLYTIFDQVLDKTFANRWRMKKYAKRTMT